MYQCKVDLDMLNTVKSVLADVSSFSPCSDEGLTLKTSANTLFTAFSIYPYLISNLDQLHFQGDVWICMELMKASLDKLYKVVYSKEGRRIPEDVLGKIAVAVSVLHVCLLVTVL